MPTAGNESNSNFGFNSYTPPKPMDHQTTSTWGRKPPKKTGTAYGANGANITQSDYKAGGGKYSGGGVKRKPKAKADTPKGRGTGNSTRRGSGSGSRPSGSIGGGSGPKGTAKKTASKPPAKKSASSSKSTTDYNKIAKDAVAAELDPKLKAVKDAQKAYNEQQSRLQQENQKRGKQVSADLDFLYKKLDEQLAAQQQQTAAAYGSATTAVDQNYANLIASLTSNTNQSVEQVNAEAARLGLAAPVESQAGADGNFANMLAQTNRQNAALMLSAQAGNAAETGNFIRNAEQGLGVQTNADFTAGNTRALNDLINQQLQQDTQYDNQLTDLEMQRSTMEKQYMQQLEQQAYDRAQEAKQQALMNSLAVGKFNLSQDKFNADQEYRKAQLELEALRIQQAAQKATGGSGSGATLNPGGATDYITSTIKDPNTEAGLLQAWNYAKYSGEFDFNNSKNRNQVIESMRQWLQQNRPELIRSNEFLGYLSNAYDVYTGVKYV